MLETDERVCFFEKVQDYELRYHDEGSLNSVRDKLCMLIGNEKGV